jgi:hypothetical protein
METNTIIHFDASQYATRVQAAKKAVKTCNLAIYALSETLEIGLNDSDDLHQFMKNPLSYFDAQMLAKLEFKSDNPNYQLLGELHNINREGFVQSVYGKTPKKDCSICNETDSLPMVAPCTVQYNQHKRYMSFNADLAELELNETLLEVELKHQLTTYATPEEQKKIDFANDFISMINKGFEMGFLGYNTAQDLKRVHIGYAPAINRVSLPENIGHFINLINL